MTIRHRLTARDAEWATGMAAMIAREKQADVDAFAGDSKAAARLYSQECKTCFYLRGSVCGQAFTSYICGLCGTEQMHHNTCVPRLCRECATANELCRQCGGDIDMRQRRNNWPSPLPAGGAR